MANCPKHHGLTKFHTHHDRFSCDECGQYQAKGTEMWGCRECNHDICSPCRHILNLKSLLVRQHEDNELMKSYAFSLKRTNHCLERQLEEKQTIIDGLNNRIGAENIRYHEAEDRRQKLQGLVESKDEEIDLLKTLLASSSEEVKAMKQELEEKQVVITSLNHLAEHQQQQHRLEVDIIQERYQVLYQRYNDLQPRLAASDLNHSALSQKYRALQSEYKALSRKLHLDESDYLKWSDEDITQWILSLDDELKDIEDALSKNLKTERVHGGILNMLDKSDLHRLGILRFDLKLKVFNAIQNLTNQHKAPNPTESNMIDLLQEGLVMDTMNSEEL